MTSFGADFGPDGTLRLEHVLGFYGGIRQLCPGLDEFGADFGPDETLRYLYVLEVCGAILPFYGRGPFVRPPYT